MKIFVTGCAGLLGANYTRHLLANGHEVIGIDDLSGGYKENIHKDVKLYTHDLATEDIEYIFDFHDIQYVYQIYEMYNTDSQHVSCVYKLKIENQ